MSKFKLQRKKTFVIIILGLFIVVCVLVALLSMNRNIFAFALSVGEYEDSSVINENEFLTHNDLLDINVKY